MASECVDILILARSLGGKLTDETQGPMNVLVGADHCILGFTMIGSAATEVMAATQAVMPACLQYPQLRDAVSASDNGRRSRPAIGERVAAPSHSSLIPQSRMPRAVRRNPGEVHAERQARQ